MEPILLRAMAATHLDGGGDVVLPQYFGTLAEITAFEKLARDHGAGFREVVLLDDRAAAIERFDRRARDNDDPWIQHHRRVGTERLGRMHDDLMAVVRLRSDAVVVRSVLGAVEETYELLVAAL